VRSHWAVNSALGNFKPVQLVGGRSKGIEAMGNSQGKPVEFDGEGAFAS